MKDQKLVEVTITKLNSESASMVIEYPDGRKQEMSLRPSETLSFYEVEAIKEK